MNSNKIIYTLKKNAFLTLCFIALLSLCFYQTWLRKKETLLIDKLTKKVNLNEDKKYVFDRLYFSLDIIDSLDKLDREKLLVLRFVRNDCHECIDSIFNNLSNVGSSIGKENIVILVDEPNLSDYYKYKRLYQEKITNFFYYPAQNSTIDKGGLSYYALYSKKNKSASFVFLTRPLDFPSQTSDYLKEIVNVF